MSQHTDFLRLGTASQSHKMPHNTDIEPFRLADHTPASLAHDKERKHSTPLIHFTRSTPIPPHTTCQSNPYPCPCLTPSRPFKPKTQTLGLMPPRARHDSVDNLDQLLAHSPIFRLLVLALPCSLPRSHTLRATRFRGHAFQNLIPCHPLPLQITPHDPSRPAAPVSHPHRQLRLDQIHSAALSPPSTAPIRRYASAQAPEKRPTCRPRR